MSRKVTLDELIRQANIINVCERIVATQKEMITYRQVCASCSAVEICEEKKTCPVKSRLREDDDYFHGLFGQLKMFVND